MSAGRCSMAKVHAKVKKKPSLIFEHRALCMPLNPCVSCQIAQVIRRHVQGSELEKLLALIAKAEGSTYETIRLEKSAFAKPAILAIRLETLDFSTRTQNCLRDAGIVTVEDLLKKTKRELKNIRNFGKLSLGELEWMMDTHGHKLEELVQ